MRFIGLLLFVLIPFFGYSQYVNPPRGRVYNDSVLITVNINLPVDSLSALYLPGNECSDHEYPVTFIWSDGILPNDTVLNVGIRFKGNTSRFAKKKSFKLSFNTFKSGRNFYDVEKLNFNGEHNDPSVIREKLFWDAMYQNNLPALSCNYVKVFINGAYYGIYINIEDLDEIFTQTRFGNSDGNLYKCYYGADLTYKGVNGNSYKMTGNFCNKIQRVYELQNNIVADNYQSLADFINALNNLPADTTYAAKIKKYFNVESYLQMMALEVASGHWDNYVWNNNNFFLYQNTYTNQMEYISYDADNTFGIGWSSDDWGTKNVYQFNAGKTRPLFTKLLAIPEFKTKYDYYLYKFVSTTYDTSIIFPRIDSLHNLIWGAAVADTLRTKDYGFTVGQFHNSYSQTIGVAHVKYGLKPFFTARNTSIKQQISHNNIIPVLLNERHQPEFGSITDLLHFTISGFDDESPLALSLFYSFDLAGGFTKAFLFDDGLHQDGIAGDGYYGFSLPAHGNIDTCIFFYTATSPSGQVARYPSYENLSLYLGIRSNLKLRINELMPKNTSVIADEFGEFDDWLEVYNLDNNAIDLSTLYLSNSLTNPTKFKLPAVTLPANKFSLFWCDNQTAQGIYHVNFKLSAGGEWVGLFDAKGLLIDSVSYLNANDNISYGRITDGLGSFIWLGNRTPGYSNQGNSYGLWIDNDYKSLDIFPNPANNSIQFKLQNNCKEFQYHLLNNLGQKIYHGIISNSEIELNISSLPSGIYFLCIDGLTTRKIVINH